MCRSRTGGALRNLDRDDRHPTGIERRLTSRAEADRPMHIGDVMELAGFWGDLLSR